MNSVSRADAHVSAMAFASEAFWIRTKLWPMAAFGICPTCLMTTVTDSPGAAVIAAGSNFMLSPVLISMTRGAAAGRRAAADATPEAAMRTTANRRAG